MNLRCFSFAALTLLALSRANVCAGSPAFTKEAQGNWYVLAAHQNNKNITADKGTGSKVTITADRLVWHNSEKPDVPLLDATCQRANPNPWVDEKCRRQENRGQFRAREAIRRRDRERPRLGSTSEATAHTTRHAYWTSQASNLGSE